MAKIVPDISKKVLKESEKALSRDGMASVKILASLTANVSQSPNIDYVQNLLTKAEASIREFTTSELLFTASVIRKSGLSSYPISSKISKELLQRNLTNEQKIVAAKNLGVVTHNNAYIKHFLSQCHKLIPDANLGSKFTILRTAAIFLHQATYEKALDAILNEIDSPATTPTLYLEALSRLVSCVVQGQRMHALDASSFIHFSDSRATKSARVIHPPHSDPFTIRKSTTSSSDVSSSPLSSPPVSSPEVEASPLPTGGIAFLTPPRFETALQKGLDMLRTAFQAFEDGSVKELPITERSCCHLMSSLSRLRYNQERTLILAMNDFLYSSLSTPVFAGQLKAEQRERDVLYRFAAILGRILARDEGSAIGGVLAIHLVKKFTAEQSPHQLWQLYSLLVNLLKHRTLYESLHREVEKKREGKWKTRVLPYEVLCKGARTSLLGCVRYLQNSGVLPVVGQRRLCVVTKLVDGKVVLGLPLGSVEYKEEREERVGEKETGEKEGEEGEEGEKRGEGEKEKEVKEWGGNRLMMMDRATLKNKTDRGATVFNCELPQGEWQKFYAGRTAKAASRGALVAVVITKVNYSGRSFEAKLLTPS